jgi:hypothetical protein
MISLLILFATIGLACLLGFTIKRFLGWSLKREIKLRSICKNKKAYANVALIVIILIPLTFAAWLATYTPVAMIIDTLGGMTDDPNAHRIFDLANIVIAGLLIGEILVLLVWLGASAFRRHEQTYYVGGGY